MSSTLFIANQGQGYSSIFFLFAMETVKMLCISGLDLSSG